MFVKGMGAIEFKGADASGYVSTLKHRAELDTRFLQKTWYLAHIQNVGGHMDARRRRIRYQVFTKNLVSSFEP
jgi:hypothetical protein